MAPRWPQDGPKMAPRGPQDGPRWAQDGPKMVPRRKMKARNLNKTKNLHFLTVYALFNKQVRSQIRRESKIVRFPMVFTHNLNQKYVDIDKHACFPEVLEPKPLNLDSKERKALNERALCLAVLSLLMFAKLYFGLHSFA